MRISFDTDEHLSLGEFGIQARLVRPAGQSEGGGAASTPPVEEDEHGKTMIYSTSARVRGPVEEAHAGRLPRALLAVDGRRLLLPPAGGTVGRSRECDVVLADTGISRQHAQIRPGGAGWEIEDLGSTNGVLVNGTPVTGRQALRSGDLIEFGSTAARFELA